MKTLVIDGDASRIEIKDGTIVLHYADEPKAVLPAQTEVKPIAPPWELKEFSSKGGNADTEAQLEARRINMAKATAARVAKRKAAQELGAIGGSANTAQQNKTRANNLVAARAERARQLAERNSKPAAQIENEAAKEIIGSLFKIAQRNEEAKNA